MEQELTRWFPSHIKPLRPGVYETQFAHDEPGFSYWNGGMWSSTAVSPEYADRLLYCNPRTQSKVWRGLAHPPKEQQ